MSLSEKIARNNAYLRSKNYGYTDDQVFDEVSGTDRGHTIDLFTNRPDDAGTLEGVQNVLGAMGVVADPFDWLNAAIYTQQGDLENAAWAWSGLGILGAVKGGKKLFKYNPKKRYYDQDMTDEQFLEEVIRKDWETDLLKQLETLNSYPLDDAAP